LISKRRDSRIPFQIKEDMSGDIEKEGIDDMTDISKKRDDPRLTNVAASPSVPSITTNEGEESSSGSVTPNHAAGAEPAGQTSTNENQNKPVRRTTINSYDSTGSNDSSKSNTSRLFKSRRHGKSRMQRPSTESLLSSLDDPSSASDSSVAAANLVATLSGNKIKQHVRFNVGDKALVYLSVLNHTTAFEHLSQLKTRQRLNITGSELDIKASKGDSDAMQNDMEEDVAKLVAKSTRVPVNRLGFPQGQGETKEEKSGPWIYVLATVTAVHFEEDARYYTVQVRSFFASSSQD